MEQQKTDESPLAQRPQLSAELGDMHNPLTPVMDAILLDARRYRWIRSKTSRAILLIDGVDEGLALESMDLAIDEAMELSSNAEVSGAGTASAGLPGYAGDNNGERK